MMQQTRHNSDNGDDEGEKTSMLSSRNRERRGYDSIPSTSYEREEDDVRRIDINMPLAHGGRSRATIESMSFLGVLVNLVLIPLFVFLPIISAFFTVQPQQHVLIVFWGSLVKVIKRPGLYWFLPFGRTMCRISTATQSIDIKRSTVVDKNGNPIVVSGVVTFQIVDSVRAAFDVINYSDYVERQAVAVLKRACSLYPYECRTGKSLQSESREVSALLVRLLQEKADVAGAHIISFELADLQYAPEIAPGMLVRQQAQALIEARNTVVDGAVTIVTAAIAKLSESGVQLNDTQQAKLVSNLLAVICSDAHVTPTFSVSDDDGEKEAQVAAEAQMKQMTALLAQLVTNTTPK